MKEDLSGTFNAVQPSLFDEMKKALNHRNLEAVPSLLQRGADVDQTGSNDNTALILAAIRGDFALAHILVGKDADLERRNGHGNTALMLAAANGRADIVRLLVDAGAEINKRNDDGHGYGSARDWAEERGFKEIVQILDSAVRHCCDAEAAAAREKIRHDAVAARQSVLREKIGPRKIKIRKSEP